MLMYQQKKLTLMTVSASNSDSALRVFEMLIIVFLPLHETAGAVAFGTYLDGHFPQQVQQYICTEDGPQQYCSSA
jgi:hypothetical protein